MDTPVILRSNPKTLFVYGPGPQRPFRYDNPIRAFSTRRNPFFRSDESTSSVINGTLWPRPETTGMPD